MSRATVIAAAALLASFGAHALLIELLADGTVVASLLSPGAHSAVAALLVSAAFLVLRLSLLVALPGVVVGLAAAAVVSGLAVRVPS